MAEYFSDRFRRFNETNMQNFNTAPDIRYDNYERLGVSTPGVSNTAVHFKLKDPQAIDAAPFVHSTYQVDPSQDDREYTGTYTDPETGIQYHTWEETMFDRDVDYNLNPDDDVMERLFEQATGGTNDDVRAKLGVPDYKPEENYLMTMTNPQDGLRPFAADEAVRAYDNEVQRAQALRKMENNFQGIDERVGGPTGYVGYQPMHYARVQDVKGKVTAYELDDRQRFGNAKSHVDAAAPRTAPTVVSRQENFNRWRSHHTYGHKFGFREINEYPGDREAKQNPPKFIHNPPRVQFVLQ